jgi:ELWxxDGT repeat protein
VTTELWRTDGTEAGTTRVWQAPGRFNGDTIRGLTSVGGAVLFTAPTRADANGLATDVEPYILSVRGSRGGNDGPSASDDETSLDDDDDAATETRATVDDAGLPIERSTAARQQRKQSPRPVRQPQFE